MFTGPAYAGDYTRLTFGEQEYRFKRSTLRGAFNFKLVNLSPKFHGLDITVVLPVKSTRAQNATIASGG